MPSVFQRPRHRSVLRKLAGRAVFSLKRFVHWFTHRDLYVWTISSQPLPYLAFTHRTPLYRQLKDVDPWLQVNKAQNIRLAIRHLDGLTLRPGKALSYWKAIGNPTKRKGYLPGMVLDRGTFHAETGGGLCQLSNLLYWMTLHTPLTVSERWRHGYDVFPDASRTQPFGSGATCYYPFLDLVIKNETSALFQLHIFVEDDFLVGEWRSSEPTTETYRIEERNHRIVQAPWGGYVRMNELAKISTGKDGTSSERVVVKNEAVMMYDPLLPAKNE